MSENIVITDADIAKLPYLNLPTNLPAIHPDLTEGYQIPAHDDQTNASKWGDKWQDYMAKPFSPPSVGYPVMPEGYKPPASCLDCKYRQIIPDPDHVERNGPNHVAVVCLLVDNPYRNDKSVFIGDRQDRRCITMVARVENLRLECDKTEWCPADPLVDEDGDNDD